MAIFVPVIVSVYTSTLGMNGLKHCFENCIFHTSRINS